MGVGHNAPQQVLSLVFGNNCLHIFNFAIVFFTLILYLFFNFALGHLSNAIVTAVGSVSILGNCSN